MEAARPRCGTTTRASSTTPTATLWNNHTGIINHPYDNKKFDHEGEREVVNAIVALPNR